MNDILNSIKKFVSNSNPDSSGPSEGRDQSDVQESDAVVQLTPLSSGKGGHEAKDHMDEGVRESVEMPEFIRKSAKSLEVEEKSLDNVEGQTQEEPIKRSSTELYLQQLLVSLKAFSEKNEKLHQRSTESLDDFIRTMLGDLVQKWLDKNLKDIVEEVVERNVKSLIENVLKGYS